MNAPKQGCLEKQLLYEERSGLAGPDHEAEEKEKLSSCL